MSVDINKVINDFADNDLSREDNVQDDEVIRDDGYIDNINSLRSKEVQDEDENTEQQEDEEKNVEEEVVEEDKEDEEDEEKINLKDTVNVLKQQVEFLTNLVSSKKQEQPKTEKQLKKEFFENSDFKRFINSTEWDDNQKESFVAFMKGFQQHSINAAVEKAVEEAMLKTPEISKKMINDIAKQQSYANNFYKQHPELDNADIKPFVSTVANKLAAEMPNATTEQILKLTAQKVKNVLKLEVSKTKPKKKNPAFSNVKNVRKLQPQGKNKKSLMQEQIESVINAR